MIRIARPALAALLTLLVVLATGCSAPPVSGSASSGAPSVSGAPEGAAVVSGDVQKIAVDLSQGYYDPTVIRAKAGLPLEISFGQGQGCLASVLVPDFGVNQDLTSGGAVVKLPAMEPGEHDFSCGMRMVFGKIIVQ